MINVENITKSFGAQSLFEGVSFKLNHRERLGVVGRNGHGKTTLFRMIIGKDHPDSGTITIPKNYRIGYVRQHLDFTEDTVLKEGMKGLPEQEKDHHWKVEKILGGLGFSNADMHRCPGEFSGGFQVRLNLAKVLVSEPDLLLLDEPTNYLDITSIRWVKQFLINWPHELMLITHDRSFMDKVVTHTMTIYRRKVRKITGNTGKLYEQIAQEEEIYEKTRMNDERKQKEIEQFITRFRAKARLANMVQSRVKTLEKMEKRDKLEAVKNLDFSFRSKPLPGKHVMSARNISFSYDSDTPLIRDFSISVGPRERICVVGKNGKGKTTLLKILADAIQPREGETVCNPAVEKGFYEQTNVRTLVDTRTVEEEFLYSNPEVDRQHARSICGAMMFYGDAALKKISVLSGGEKSRVMLGKLLVTPVNLLLLDEPTNHLDMESCDALLAAIDNFDGVVIMVTHNEMFLHALAERLIVFQNNGISVFDGTYQNFLEKGGWEDESSKHMKPSESAQKNTAEEEGLSKLTKKEMRRRRSEIISERGKVLKPVEQRITRAEDDIERYEKEMVLLNEAMQTASQAQDGTKIVEISQSIHVCQAAIDKLFDDLETFTNTLEGQHAIFEKKLQQLEDFRTE
ncbi:ABC-F family ATP-binding cassette domain-containing protein [Desulfonema magnum]|uniref:ABC transporter, ATP-binding protein n=1 Tax=Desulfonema magnum TaxID=45655 RepID=A0A975BT24_9BACT|nr:ABC-F family ATP-binding cassette domain-containing protein [Desulfonema magnum]QTA91131.1 putative ABC transporter, ATP-binding protein [Desulfonema magnum]